MKKKKPEEEKEPILNIKDIPAPHKIKAKLDEYVGCSRADLLIHVVQIRKGMDGFYSFFSFCFITLVR